MKWQTTRISTEFIPFEEINSTLLQPVGIILIGADGDHKDEVERMLIENIKNLAFGYGGKGSLSLRAAKKPLCEDGRPVLTVMFGNKSADHEQRHNTVQALRDLGAASVVCVYADDGNVSIPAPSVMAKLPENEQAFYRDVAQLHSTPPTADGLDRLYTVIA